MVGRALLLDEGSSSGTGPQCMQDVGPHAKAGGYGSLQEGGLATSESLILAFVPIIQPGRLSG